MEIEYNTPGYELDRGRAGKDIVTKREVYTRFGRQDDIEEADIPEEGQHIWAWFWTLNQRRQSGMDGPQPLTYTEIQAWQSSTGVIVRREETAILFGMDNTFLETLAKTREDQRVFNEKPS